MIPHLAYVDFPRQRVKTERGILKYSIVLAKAKEFGGMIHSFDLISTKLLGSNFFGSTTDEKVLVKILNSSAHLTS